jgi:hypothetical protein
MGRISRSRLQVELSLIVCVPAAVAGPSTVTIRAGFFRGELVVISRFRARPCVALFVLSAEDPGAVRATRFRGLGLRGHEPAIADG